MLIRKARKDEITVLQNLNDDVFADNKYYDPDIKMEWAQSDEGKRYFKETLDNPESICLIAEDKEKPIGYIVATPKVFDFRLSKYIEIENMGIIPQHRSKGVGTLLMKKCFELAKEKGYQKVYVTSYYKNSKAVDFYKRNGFKPIDLSLEIKI